MAYCTNASRGLSLPVSLSVGTVSLFRTVSERLSLVNFSLSRVSKLCHAERDIVNVFASVSPPVTL